MSSITKIKVADTTYDIKDNISGYITKDIADLTNYYDKEQVDYNIEQVSEDIPTRTSQLTNDSGFIGTAALASKQNTLVSGSNIKTINGESVLGSGNLTVKSQGEINLVDDVRMNGVSILDNKVANFYISNHYSSTNGIITNYELQIAIDAVEAEITAQGRLIPTKTSDLINDSNFISSSALNNYALLSEAANTMTMEVNTDYVLTSKLKNKNGSVINTATVDLPIEGLVMNGRYDTATKKIILTLKNGNTIEFSIADLVSDRQPLINSTHKLDSDLINTTGQTNQFVLASDKTNWNNKQNPIIAGTGITLSGSQVSVTNYNNILSSINSKQDLLTSGVNIKTINNQSLLGSGNIEIQGGGGGTSDYEALNNKPKINNIELSGNKSSSTLGLQDKLDLFVCQEDVTDYDDMVNASEDGKTLVLFDYDVCYFGGYILDQGVYFYSQPVKSFDSAGDGLIVNIKYIEDSNANRTWRSTYVPLSSKPVINVPTVSTITLANNHEYRYDEQASLNILLPSMSFIADDFACSLVFSSGSTATVFTAPNTIKWLGDGVDNNAFTPEANTRYNIVFWYDGVNVNAIVRGV